MNTNDHRFALCQNVCVYVCFHRNRNEVFFTSITLSLGSVFLIFFFCTTALFFFSYEQKQHHSVCGSMEWQDPPPPHMRPSRLSGALGIRGTVVYHLLFTSPISQNPYNILTTRICRSSILTREIPDAICCLRRILFFSLCCSRGRWVHRDRPFHFSFHSLFKPWVAPSKSGVWIGCFSGRCCQGGWSFPKAVINPPNTPSFGPLSSPSSPRSPLVWPSRFVSGPSL